VTIFGDLAASWPSELAERLATRELVARLELPDTAACVLDSSYTVTDEDGPVVGDALIRQWPARATAQDLQDAVAGLELERAARPPVIAITAPGARLPLYVGSRPSGAAPGYMFPPVSSRRGVMSGQLPPRRPRRNVLFTTVQLRRRLRFLRLFGPQ
jgi:hypothetical protein